MKKRIPTFLAGMVTTALIGALSLTALAATGAVSFNASPIQFNGTLLSAKGEDYTLTNGCKAPSSVTYTDEKGGGTTYLPVRRIAEITGVKIGYDAGTGSVTVTGDAAENPKPDIPASGDYSDWTAEEEKAYQEFKGMWEIQDNGGKTNEAGQSGISIFAENRNEYHTTLLSDLKLLGDSHLTRMLNRFCIEVIEDKYDSYNQIFFSFSVGNTTISAGLVRTVGSEGHSPLRISEHIK